MSAYLIAAVERVLGSVSQEFDKDASVMVQFAAGDWHALKQALHFAKNPDAPDTPVVPVVAPFTDEEVFKLREVIKHYGQYLTSEQTAKATEKAESAADLAAFQQMAHNADPAANPPAQPDTPLA